jgi:hypothetical protein
MSSSDVIERATEELYMTLTDTKIPLRLIARQEKKMGSSKKIELAE